MESIPVSTTTNEYRECFKCGFRGETSQANCPKCGKVLRTSKNIRIRGIILVVVGAFLVVMMAGLGIFIGALIAKADPSSAKKMADERAIFIGTYALFGVIALFGLNGIAMGTWQIVFGKRNKVFIWIMFALLALILMACFATVYMIK